MLRTASFRCRKENRDLNKVLVNGNHIERGDMPNEYEPGDDWIYIPTGPPELLDCRL